MTASWHDAVGSWQALLKRTLNTYMEGGYLRVRSQWSFPLNWQLAPQAVRGALTELAQASIVFRHHSNELEVSRYLERLELALRRLHSSPESALLDILVEGYQLLNDITRLEDCEGRAETIRLGSEFDGTEYSATDARYFAPVTKLVQQVRTKMSPYLTVALIHGSVADLNYAMGYTDLDTLLVLNRETMTDPDRLCEFARICYRSLAELHRFDPLQHHGHLIATEVDLKAYPENWMPLPALSAAKVVHSLKDHISVHVRDSQREARLSFEYAVEYLHLLKLRGWIPRRAYDLKLFLSSLMLLPARYLQARGIYCAKRDSFQLARELLPTATWDAVDYATQFRLDWPYARDGAVDLLGSIAGFANVRLVREVQSIALKRRHHSILSSFAPLCIEHAAELAEQMIDDLLADEPRLVSVPAVPVSSRASADGLQLSVANHPVARTQEEYEDARERYVTLVKGIPGVEAIYQFGSVTSPGLSDLDFLVSVSDSVPEIEVELLSIDPLPFWDRSLILHDAIVVPESQWQSVQEFLPGADLQMLWCHDSNSQPLKTLDPQLASNAMAAKLVEKLSAYQVWFADVLEKSVLDARWAIATLKSLLYSASLVESVTGTTLGNTQVYAQSVDELRDSWFEEPDSTYRKNDALRSLFLSGQVLNTELIETLDRFFIKSGWLGTRNASDDNEAMFPVPQSRICVTFGTDAPGLGDGLADLPPGTFRLITLPASFKRAFALYAHCASDLARALTIGVPQGTTQAEPAPQTEFERYLCTRASQLEVQTRFLLRHGFWFGSHLPTQLLWLPRDGS